MVETTEQYRNRINQLKTGIENEPYIKKMREDIAEGIYKTGNRQADIEVRQDTLEDDFIAVQQDARSNTPSGAELAVASGEYNTLGERLDAEEQKVTAQLAQKASKDEVDLLLGDISDGTPLFANDITKMTDPNRLYVNISDGLVYAHNGQVFVSTGVRYQSTGISYGAVENKHLSTSYTPRKMSEVAYYPLTQEDGALSIYNEPLQTHGILDISFLSGKAANGYIYILEKQVNANIFSVLKVYPVVTEIGENTIQTNYFSKGDGTEYVGFFNVGIKVRVNSTTGLGRFERKPFTVDVVSPFTVLNYTSQVEWEFGYETTFSDIEMTKELNEVKSALSEVQEIKQPTLTPLNLLRFEETKGNFNVTPNVYFFGRWFNKNIDGVDYVSSINQGAEIFAKVRNTSSVKAQFKNISTGTGYISVSIDGGKYSRYVVADEITIASNLTLGEHYINIIVSSLYEGDRKWDDGVGCNFKQLIVNSGGEVIPVKPYNRYGLYYGDSITEGISVLGPGGTVDVNCAEQAFPTITSKLLNAVNIRVGHGATGITKSGNGGVPKLLDQVDYNYSGVLESAQKPDYIVINHGTNDGGSLDSDFKSEYIKAIDKIRLKYPGVLIFCMRPFNGSKAIKVSEVSSLFDNTVYVDTSGWNPSTSDGVHLNSAGHLLAGTKLAEKIKQVFGTSYFYK